VPSKSPRVSIGRPAVNSARCDGLTRDPEAGGLRQVMPRCLDAWPPSHLVRRDWRSRRRRENGLAARCLFWLRARQGKRAASTRSAERPDFPLAKREKRLRSGGSNQAAALLGSSRTALESRFTRWSASPLSVRDCSWVGASCALLARHPGLHPAPLRYNLIYR
jgi:hypothetical protein